MSDNSKSLLHNLNQFDHIYFVLKRQVSLPRRLVYQSNLGVLTFSGVCTIFFFLSLSNLPCLILDNGAPVMHTIYKQKWQNDNF